MILDIVIIKSLLPYKFIAIYYLKNFYVIKAIILLISKEKAR